MSTVRFPDMAQPQKQGGACGGEGMGGDKSIIALCFCTNVQYIQFNLCHDVMAFFF